MNRVTKVHFTAVPTKERTLGLLGFVRCVYDDALELDGLTLRRTRDGRPTLSWPARFDGAGNKRFVVRPLSDTARLEVEEAVFEALGIVSPAV